jgi:hypothetical protein
MKISKKKESILLERAYQSLGYRYDEIKNISDLDLWEADTKQAILQLNDLIDNCNELLETSKSSLEKIDEIRNEYEKEILRDLNPKLKIY